MTYLELVNAVLRRLRENEVTSITESYPKLIGDFVNDTIKEVANAWNWHSGRTTVVVSTTANTASYSLDDVGHQFRYLSVWNNTDSSYMTQVSSGQMDYFYYSSSTDSTGSPSYFATNSFDPDTMDPIVDVYPLPDTTYQLLFNVYVPHRELSGDSEICNLPSNLIILGAWAKAISERGEDGGQNTIEQQMMYRSSLADAISMEESLTVGETTWQLI